MLFVFLFFFFAFYVIEQLVIFSVGSSKYIINRLLLQVERHKERHVKLL